MSVEVTAEMVMEVAAVTREKAEGVAAYANHRFAGLLKVDARREAGVSESTAYQAEKLLPALKARHGLPEPPTQNGLVFYSRDWAASGQSGAHQRNHIGRGLVSPDCPLCRGDAS
jgi:hypothetical protein